MPLNNHWCCFFFNFRWFYFKKGNHVCLKENAVPMSWYRTFLVPNYLFQRCRTVFFNGCRYVLVPNCLVSQLYIGLKSFGWKRSWLCLKSYSLIVYWKRSWLHKVCLAYRKFCFNSNNFCKIFIQVRWTCTSSICSIVMFSII